MTEVQPEELEMIGPKGIASVEIAVNLVRTIEASPEPLLLKEIADAVGFSSSKAYHYLVSLVRSGLLERERGGMRYGLGSFSLQLGLTALARTGTAHLVADAVRALRDEVGHATAFSVWSTRGAVVRHLEESKEALGVSMRLGTVLPLLNSPTTDIFLAWLPDEELKPALAALPQKALPLKKLVAIRQETRQQGGAHASGVRTPSIAGAAAPVFGGRGRLVGALSTLGLVGQFDDRPTSKVSRALHRHARALSDTLATQM
ncbi:IclR family transcriptional regulator [Variovorax sp. WS11]|uniref:IclR family transcriptional regulator n=2 Tax=Variovorax sp. WS11 TaxID=1105204 RepID=UPI0015E68873|nr:IclR family transcriptional regulator [Variovorax sp. WS11]